MPKPTRLHRREFLGQATRWGGAAALAGTGCGNPRPSESSPAASNPATPRANPTQPPAEASPALPVPGSQAGLPSALPDGLVLDNFTLYTRTPLTLEAKRSRLGIGPVTPLSRLFVRNNLPLPDRSIVDNPDAWTLAVSGTRQRRAFTLSELKTLGITSVAAVLQCSGNGRRFFPHGPSGSPWGVGAAGCVVWTGVPVATVLQAAGGPGAQAKYLTTTGADPLPDLPEGLRREDLLVERSIPLDKALADALLAWEVNGVPLPLTHGGPLRLVVPGYYGVNNIKYAKSLACTAEQSPAKIQRTGYRVRPVGEKAAPDQPSMWRMNVKSWINGPGADGEIVLAGEVQLYGVAFSGERSVTRVEVSVDGGRTWGTAEWVGPDLGAAAWRTFRFEVKLAAGRHRLVSRATDSGGATQPRRRVENHRGYANNSWDDMALEIDVFNEPPADAATRPRAQTEAEAGPVALSESAQRGRELFLRGASPPCGTCHTLAEAQTAMKVGPNLDDLAPPVERVERAVSQGVGAMAGYADRLSPQERLDLATYVYEATRRRGGGG
ncbi:MAG: sulfite oxidase [Myxococcales bacterium FL481]|nr:MAG: sulfite oxidase [Myxococcales bacterium FL481]